MEECVDESVSWQSYTKLSDVKTQLYEKDWTKTYKLLLTELKLRKNCL